MTNLTPIQKATALATIARWTTSPDIKHTNKIEQDILSVLKLLVEQS